MTSSQRDPIPRPSRFERLLHEVPDVTDEHSGARVHGVFGEWLDGAGCACEQAKNPDPDGQLSTAWKCAGIAAMMRVPVRRTEQPISA